MGFYLADIRNEENLKSCFIEKWNWSHPDISSLSFDFPEEIKDNISSHLILAEKEDFKVLFFGIKNLSNPEKELKRVERRIITTPRVRQEVERAIFVFSSNNFDYLDFVKAEKLGSYIKIKRFSITPENRSKLRTPCEQLEKLKLEPNEISYSYIKNKIEEAFSVEAVTEKFYQEYIYLFEKIKGELIKQKVEIEPKIKGKKLSDFIHQILNRIMFLYFVQKRGCFGNDKNFLANFWDAYKTNFKGEEKFHTDWLNVLFFEALCQPPWLYKEKAYLKDFNEILKNAPYLNGGLFERNELDEIGWKIPDTLFDDDIFEFFESYNFTIEESTPFEIDIAINPEMLGNIYEQLVNVEEKEEQAKAGIFYTPKVEIDLMIRRALVEFLFNKTKITKEKLYQFVFPEEEIEIKDPFTKEEAEKVLYELDNILILDPACGSGHYLVVAEQILYELKENLWKKLNKPHLSKYEEKKRIIERNIYGNDIKEWAVNVAKLRLWLDLFVDADDDILQNQSEPLLPNLNFKIRCGDSLVQRLERNLLPLRRIKSFVRGRRKDLEELIKKKEHVYKTSDPREYKNTLYLEKKLLLNALEDMKIVIIQKISEILSQLKKEYPTLFPTKNKIKQIQLFEKELKKQKELLERILNEIETLAEELKKEKEPPMLWDLAFAEVFQMKNGFDIVIANPPYVRQERIEDLTGFHSKNEYKEKLIEQTRLDWSYDYEGKIKSKSPIPEKFDKKCDLYVYFYLKGLKLLNPDGVLCYISSNSWLDVGFGRILQEVLIKRCPILAIYDNQVKRSFKHADINTIIALIKAPKERDFDEEVKNNEVRFVMFKKPFEEVMYSEIFIDLEKDYDLKAFQEGKRRENEIYRLHIVNQKDLWEFGKDEETGEYIGNKWGGKYLRAPEIYWKILEKGKGKLVRLGDIAEVKRGFTTGANEFFYVEDVTDKIEFSEIKSRIKNLENFKSLEEIKKAGLRIIRNTKTGDYWLIEEEFLKPVIISLNRVSKICFSFKEIENIRGLIIEESVDLEDFKFLCQYLKWGEKEKLNKRKTIASRKIWYILPHQKIGPILFPYFYTDTYFVLLNSVSIYANKELYVLYPTIDPVIICALLNSTFYLLYWEIFSISNVPSLIKIRVYDLPETPILAYEIIKEKGNDIQKYFNQISSRPVKSIFTELGFDPNKPIHEQEPRPLPDRKALDDIVFDALGLTEEEKKEVYWAVAELVQNRLKKAKSV
jgi:type I restriction-modification system DNA methylase subunit